jgi:hypothetical protein
VLSKREAKEWFREENIHDAGADLVKPKMRVEISAHAALIAISLAEPGRTDA